MICQNVNHYTLYYILHGNGNNMNNNNNNNMCGINNNNLQRAIRFEIFPSQHKCQLTVYRYISQEDYRKQMGMPPINAIPPPTTTTNNNNNNGPTNIHFAVSDR
eukprot:UN08879